jgi:hypothetical protein
MDILDRVKGRGHHRDEDDGEGQEEDLTGFDDSLVGEGDDNPFIAITKGSRRDISSRKRKTSWKNEENARFDGLCLTRGVTPRCKTPPGLKNGASGLQHSCKIFDSVMSALEDKFRIAIQQEDRHVLAEVDELATHCLKRHTHGYDHVIPTALVFGGGVNSADHSRLFPEIKKYLEGKNCRVASLSPNAFTGKTVGFTLGKMIDQMKRGESEVDCTDVENECFDMDDMIEWYKTSVAPSADTQPLIIIVESVETTQSEKLQDLIHTLHEAYPFFPHLLMLGLTTARETLADALPHSMVDRCLCCYKFSMASSMVHLESFAEMLVTKDWHGCLIKPEAFEYFVDFFFLNHFTVSAMFGGMKLAMTELFLTHPCPSLVEKSFTSKSDFKAHLESLSIDELKSIFDSMEIKKKRLKTNSLKSQLADAIFEKYCRFREIWEGWRFAVWLLTYSGKAVEVSSSFSIWRIFEMRAGPGFMTTSLPALISGFNKKIDVLKDEQLIQLHDHLIKTYSMQYRNSEWLVGSSKQVIADLEALIKGWKKGVQRPIRSDVTTTSERSDDEDSLAMKWSKVLCSYLLEELGADPWSEPAAKFFVCQLEPIIDNLAASTRENIHRALTQPKIFYSVGDDGKDHGKRLGVDGSVEDTCVAFSLFDQDASCSNLVDWYTSFENVISMNQQPSSDSPGNDSHVGNIARFSQSLQDLQFIGVIQASRKRKGDHVQRCTFQPEVNIS